MPQDTALLDTALEPFARTTARAFADSFGRAPRWLVAAPGRVNLIGEHTDYTGGFVLPMAIDRYVVIAAAPSADPARARVHSAAVDGAVELRLDQPLAPGPPAWANYVRGVVNAFQTEGLAVAPFDALIASAVPLGGGLSSSAALEVGVATLLEAAAGLTLDPRDKARLARRAEHEFAGVPCGIMDQLASVLGDPRGPILIDCESQAARLVTIADASASILIANTNVRHALGDGEYARRRAECAEATTALGVPSLRAATAERLEAARPGLDPVVYRRARHVIGENARTLAAAAALEAGDLRQAGALMYQSHASLRDDFEVSCTELDVLVEASQAIGEEGGVLGARMTGGGFGGCTVALVRTARVSEVAERLAEVYRRRCGRELSAFVSRPARGAHVLPAATFAP
jgi:galactokinase